MSLSNHLLKDVLDLIDSISDWIRHVRAGIECDAFDGLQ